MDRQNEAGSRAEQPATPCLTGVTNHISSSDRKSLSLSPLKQWMLWSSSIANRLRSSRRFVYWRDMATRIAPVVRCDIHLTDAEDRLCTLLDEFSRHLEKERGTRTVCRISGGWVRDKVNTCVWAVRGRRF